MRFAIIDMGSSYIKSAVFDSDRAALSDKRVAPAPPRRETASPYAFEIPARFYVDTVAGIVEEAGKNAGRLDGVILATQMHGHVLESPELPGETLYVSWQDARCLETMPGTEQTYLDRLREMFPAERMADNGVAIKPSLALCNLFARQREAGKEFTGEFFTLGSYVISRLTGENVCHVSNGAPTGLVNVREMRWNADTIREAGFGGLKFPRLTATMEACGVYRASWGDVPVFPDAGDQQTATLGAMPRPGEAAVNIATAAQLARIVDSLALDKDMRYEARPYFEGRFLNTISNLPGGRTLDVFTDFMEEIGEKIYGVAPGTNGGVWKRLDRLLADSPLLRNLDSELAVDINFYETPDSLPSGAIRNITSRNLTLDSLFAATYREMARTYQRYLGVLCGDETPAGLVFTGGASWKNPPLIGAILRATGLPGRLSPMKNEIFLGMSRLAMVCSGACERLEDTRDLTLIDDEEGKE